MTEKILLIDNDVLEPDVFSIILRSSTRSHHRH